MRTTEREEAVSPVIGVILMVAITVILAAVIAVFVFGLAGDLESSAQKDVRLQMGTDSTGNVTVLVFSGNDVDSLTQLSSGGGWTNDSAIAIGTTYSFDEDKPVVITGTFNDGTTQVLAKTN